MTSAEHHERDDDAAKSLRNSERGDRPTFERHYRVGELATMWNLGRGNCTAPGEGRARRHQNSLGAQEGSHDLFGP
jgi:hypothetical protein